LKQVTSYDLDEESFELVATIQEDELLYHYKSDRYLFAYSDTELSVTTNNVSRNKKMRMRHKQSDFYREVFFKPEFPVYISAFGEKLAVYNHSENYIQILEEGKPEGKVDINYPTDKKWMKRLTMDKQTNKAYGVFKLSTGIGLKEINLETGKVKLVGVVESSFQNYEKIKVYNNSIYYLRSKILDGSKMELCKFEL